MTNCYLCGKDLVPDEVNWTRVSEGAPEDAVRVPMCDYCALVAQEGTE